MIQSISIQNFQGHKDTTIEFNRGLNIIEGSSDAGKTAVLRALVWLIYNKPGGDSFRSHWGGDTKVTVITTDGTKISRIKTNNRNEYWLNDTKFTAFKQDVPEEIRKALNLDTVNLQSQFDKFFLISETSGKVASHFNKIANLQKIDEATNYVNSKLRSIESKIRLTNQQILNDKEALKEYENLQDFEDSLIELEEASIILKEKQADSIKLSKILFRIQKINSDIEEKNKITQANHLVNGIILLKQSLLQKKVEKNKITDILDRIKEADEVGKELEYLQPCKVVIQDLLQLHDNRNIKYQKVLKLQKLYKDITNVVKAKESTLKQKLKLEQEFDRNMPDICPLCNTELK